MLVRSTVVLAIFCVAGTAQAGEKPLYQPRPQWVLAAPEPDVAKLTDADPMIVLSDQQQRLEGGAVWAFTDQAVRVVSAQMLAEVGQVALSWQPDLGDLIVHRAEILRGGERIDLIAGGQTFQVLRREQQLEQLQLNGTLTATLSVEGLRVGDVLRLSYSVTSKDKTLQGHAQAFQPLIEAPARAKFARARLSWPQGTALRWRTYAEGVAPKPVTSAGFTSIEIPLPIAKAPELPEDAPPRFRRLPILEASSFSDWQAVSAVMAPLYRTEGTIASGSPLAAEVAKIAAASPDRRVRAAAALRLVQDEVRYFYNGMDGGNYVPQAPAQTWAVRYGDCKAKTLLLLAILHALEVEAEPVLASVQLGDHLPARLPSAGAFDHVLVRATIEGQSLWLDGTGAGTRLEDLADTPAFRHVLPVRAGGAELEPLPIRPVARALMESDLELDQTAGLSLPAPFSVRFTVRGPMAMAMQAQAAQATQEQTDELAQMWSNALLGDALLAGASVRFDADRAELSVDASGIVSTHFANADRRLRAQLDRTVSAVTFAPDRARPAWKDIPAGGGDPVSAIARFRIRLPDGGAGFTLEGDQTLPASLASRQITRRASLEQGVASIEDRVSGVGAEIAAADIPAARAQLAAAKNRLLKVVAPAGYRARWQQVLEGRRGNGFAPILAMYAKAIARNPDEAHGYANRARFLLGVYDWKAALADLDKAIAIEPSVELHLMRSQAYAALKNDAGALADGQAALALDPAAAGAVARVATLRLRSGDGDGALAMVAERVAAGGSEKQNYVSLQADLLAEAGRVDEAVAALDAALAERPGRPDLLNARCWLKGTRNVALESALRDCTRAIEMAEEPAAIYDSRALVYYRMGQMDAALEDLNAAIDVAPNQAASLYLRGLILRGRGDKAGDAELAAARMIAPRIDEDYARWGIKP